MFKDIWDRIDFFFFLHIIPYSWIRINKLFILIYFFCYVSISMIIECVVSYCISNKIKIIVLIFSLSSANNF